MTPEARRPARAPEPRGSATAPRTSPALDLVTGATGYSGSYVTRRLLDAGRRVRTLTRDVRGVPGLIDAHPYRFDDPGRLAEAFEGVDTFYNTYWVRFGHHGIDHDAAVRNSRLLIDAAARAGVRRIVHISIMNPDAESPYSYHRGKALVEEAVRAAGPSYAIVRPSVLFGGGDVLVNNIAWLLRRLHVFAVPGDGRYEVRPTHVEDLADLMVALGADDVSVVRNAGGPDTFAFGDLVRLVRDRIGAAALVREVPLAAVRPLIGVVNRLTGDVTIHPEELGALMDGLAACDGEPAGGRRLDDHLRANAAAVGHRYASEVRRNFDTPCTTVPAERSAA